MLCGVALCYSPRREDISWVMSLVLHQAPGYKGEEEERKECESGGGADAHTHLWEKGGVDAHIHSP